MDGHQDGDWESKVWKSKVLPTESEDQDHDPLRNLNVHKFLGKSEMSPRVLKEFTDVVANPPSITFEKLW